jgi:hypothetical protein
MCNGNEELLLQIMKNLLIKNENYLLHAPILGIIAKRL